MRRVQELCESWGGRPGLPVLMRLMVSVDVKQPSSMHTHWSQFVPNMSTRHPRTWSSTSSSSAVPAGLGLQPGNVGPCLQHFNQGECYITSFTADCTSTWSTGWRKCGQWVEVSASLTGIHAWGLRAGLTNPKQSVSSVFGTLCTQLWTQRLKMACCVC